MNTQQLAEFGHEVYQDTEGRWTCDHVGHGGDTEATHKLMEIRCQYSANDQLETELLRDGTHPMLGGYDGSGR